MVKNILITGPIGYVGGPLIEILSQHSEKYNLIGYDTEYFIDDSIQYFPENLLQKKYKGDIRDIDKEILKDIDYIIHLAAISNDPISNKFEDATFDINYLASIELAKKAKEVGVSKFIFASSCSVYGYSETGEVNEFSNTNPLTPYAKSKLLVEESLKQFADFEFEVTCLRFATACGISDRFRLDLVLNDFVVSAYLNKKIEILSDGNPWRPLIDVIDMGRAILWAIERNGDNYLIINAGSNEWNFQVKELAEFVKKQIPDTVIYINPNAALDKRSYKVNFDMFKRLAPDFYPQKKINNTIKNIIEKLDKIKFNDYNFRKSNLIRLNKLNTLKNNFLINNELKWI